MERGGVAHRDIGWPAMDKGRNRGKCDLYLLGVVRKRVFQVLVVSKKKCTFVIGNRRRMALYLYAEQYFIYYLNINDK